MARVRIAKRRHAWGRKGRELDKGAKTIVIQIVIFFDNDVPARQLRHKVECRRSHNGAEEWFPTTAIGPYGPQPPEPFVSQSLRLIAGKHDAPIGQNGWMQGAAKVQMPNVLDVLAVLIHDKELKIRKSVALVG